MIGDHKDAKTGTEYENLLYQIRPAFGGNIIATIVNPDHRPQMATVREGVMRKEYAAKPGAGEVKPIDWKKFLKETTLKEMLAKKPEYVIEHAVKGMLPKGSLGRQMAKKLHVYAGAEHEQIAQKPEVLEIVERA